MGISRRRLVRAAFAVSAATVGYVVWLQTEVGGERATLVFDDVITTVSPMVGGALCWWAARGTPPRARLAYRLIGSACFSWALGNAVWTLYEVHLDRDPFPSLADVGYLALIPLALAGLLTLPGAPTRFRPLVRTAVDGLITAGALLFVAWELVLEDVYGRGTAETADRVLGLAYPVADIVLMVVALGVLAHLPPKRRAAPLLLGGGLLCLVVADMSFAYLTAHDDYRTGNPYDTGWFLGFLVIGLAAMAERLSPTPSARVPTADVPLGRTVHALPLAGAVVALTFLTLDYASDGRVESLPFWTAVAVALLVVARQLVNLGENASLVRSLHEYVGELERRDADLREAQAVARLGSWRWDVATNDVTWSDELYRLFSLSPGELDATYEGYLAEVDPADRDRAHRTVQRAMSTGQPFEFDHRIVRVPGRIIHGRGHVVRDASGEVTQLTGTAQDVTEVRGLAAELQRKLAELERSNADLARFASVASHDLKSPVQLVAGYLGILEEGLREHGTAHDVELVEHALRGTRRMRNLIDDVLTYSMVATEVDAPYREVDLRALVDEEVAAVVELHRGAEVDVGPLPTLPGNAAQLRQLLQNLLSNAAKFVPPDRPARARVWAVRNGPNWRVTISDNGVGIDPADRERVFEMFSRLGRVAAPGTGMGLAICRRIVEGHGGRIWIETADTGGVEVSFTIPASNEAETGVLPELPASPQHAER